MEKSGVWPGWAAAEGAWPALDLVAVEVPLKQLAVLYAALKIVLSATPGWGLVTRVVDALGIWAPLIDAGGIHALRALLPGMPDRPVLLQVQQRLLFLMALTSLEFRQFGGEFWSVLDPEPLLPYLLPPLRAVAEHRLASMRPRMPGPEPT